MNYMTILHQYLLSRNKMLFFYAFVICMFFVYYILSVLLEINNNKLSLGYSELYYDLQYHSAMAKKINIKNSKNSNVSENSINKFLKDENIPLTVSSIDNDHFLMKINSFKFSDLLDVIFEASNKNSISVYSANIFPNPDDGNDYITGEIVFFKKTSYIKKRSPEIKNSNQIVLGK